MAHGHPFLIEPCNHNPRYEECSKSPKGLICMKKASVEALELKFDQKIWNGSIIASWAPLFLFLCDGYGHRPAFDFLIVQFFHGFSGLSDHIHFDESETAAAAGLAISDDLGGRYISILAEKIAEIGI